VLINQGQQLAKTLNPIRSSELAREEEARAAEVLRINPQFSLEALQQRLPYKDPAELERHLAALRKAGLK
jgi:hypothetical protein